MKRMLNVMIRRKPKERKIVCESISLRVALLLQITVGK